MHGFTNYEQSKALYERGYRPASSGVFIVNSNNRFIRDMFFSIMSKSPEWFPAFSLADIVTMQGERFYMPPQVSVAEVIEYNMKYMLENNDSEVQECNQRLRGEYE